MEITDVKEVLQLRMENEAGQRIAAFIVVSEKGGDTEGDIPAMQEGTLVIFDGSVGNAERAFVFSSKSSVVNANDFKRFLVERKNGAYRIEDGVRVKVPRDEVTSVSLS